jgi:hypothetical protein
LLAKAAGAAAGAGATLGFSGKPTLGVDAAFAGFGGATFSAACGAGLPGVLDAAFAAGFA